MDLSKLPSVIPTLIPNVTIEKREVYGKTLLLPCVNSIIIRREWGIPIAIHYGGHQARGSKTIETLFGKDGYVPGAFYYINNTECAKMCALSYRAPRFNRKFLEERLYAVFNNKIPKDEMNSGIHEHTDIPYDKSDYRGEPHGY